MTRPPAVIALALALAAGIACVAPVDPEGHPCPCNDKSECCLATNTCMRPEDVDRLPCALPSDAAPADGGREGAGVLEAAAEAPDRPADAALWVDPDAAASPADGPVEAAPPSDSRDAAGDEPSADGPPAVCRNGGGGLLATYYDNDDFSGPTVVERASSLWLDWGTASPQARIDHDSFSARFSGALAPPATDTYTFYARADEGVRLWINGELLIDAWRGATPDPIGVPLPLVGGRLYPLLIEYAEHNGPASLEVSWKRPSTGRTAIPACALLEGAPSEPRCQAAPGDCLPLGTPPCEGGGRGLTASYYTGADFTGLEHRQTNTAVTFDWSWVPEPMRASARYHVRFEGTLDPPATDAYRFYLIADAASWAVLAINGKEVTRTQNGFEVEEAAVNVPLMGGRKTPIRVDYYPYPPTSASYLQLRWKSSSIPKGMIPACRLSAGTP